MAPTTQPPTPAPGRRGAAVDGDPPVEGVDVAEIGTPSSVGDGVAVGAAPRVPVGLRDPRRPAQRGQVDAAQPDPRAEGHDRLRQAADDPPPHPGRAHPARRPGRVRRHAGHPQAAHGARRTAQQHRRGHHPRRRRGGVRHRRHPAARPRRPVGGRPGAARRGGGGQQGRRRPGPGGARPAAPRPPSSTCPSTSPSRPAPARASMRWWSTSSAGCPKAPATTPTTW